MYVKTGAGNIILPHSENIVIISIRPHDGSPVRTRVFAKIVEIETVGKVFGDVIRELESQAVYYQGNTYSFQQYYKNYLNHEKMVESRIEV